MRIVLFLFSILFIAACHTPKVSTQAEGDILGGTRTTLPSPINVNASDGIFEQKVRVFWDKVPMSNTYKVCRSTTKNLSDCIEIEKENSRNALYDYFVEPGVLYYYWIYAIDETDNKSEASQFDSGFIPDKSPIATPAIFSPLDLVAATEEIEFSWTILESVSAYQLQIIKGSSDNWNCTNGFLDKNEIIIDTFLYANNFFWDNNSMEGFSWTVKAINREKSSYFSEYQSTIIKDDLLTQAPITDLILRNLNVVQRNKKYTATINISNQPKGEVSLLYFYSTDNSFDEKDILLSQKIVNKRSNKSIEHSFLSNKKDGYIIVVPKIKNHLVTNKAVYTNL